MAEKGLAVVEHRESQLAHPVEFSNEQVRLLAETIAKGCDQNELAFFLNVCKLKRLDPFTGQVHCVKRWDRDLGREKITVQVGIDGLRVIAARTGELAGNDEPVFDTEEGEHPHKATVTVYRWSQGKGLGERIAYTASARYSEYAQLKKDGNPNIMWTTKPFIMLGKCAEALALRKAFPDELSGMYSDEEMDQADNDGGVAPSSVDKKKPVQQPTRASEKKPEAQQQTQPAAQQTTQAAEKPGEKEISGIIEKASQAKSGTLWVTIKGEPLVVAVDGDKIDGDMKAGYFIKFRGLNKWTDKMKTESNPKGQFWSFLHLIELSPVQEGETVEKDEGKLAPDAAKAADEMFGKEPAGKAAVQGLVDSGQLTTAANLPAAKPGTLGINREKRLYAIAGQNKKTTGLTDDDIKKVLAKYPPPIGPLEHLRDLPMDLYEVFEKLCTGEVDWKEYLSD